MALLFPILSPALILFFASCQLDQSAAREENFVAVRLNDSLSRYDSVQILILADGDTNTVLGEAWDGRLAAPQEIPPFRLDDAETRPVSVRVKGFDQYGRLTLDMRISKRNGAQVVETIALPKPSPSLSALAAGPGALSPAFDPAVKEYAVSLANNQTWLQVTMTPDYPQAIMSAGLARAYSGKAVEPIDMRIGSNRIVLNITAADTSAQYVINATRAQGPADTVEVPPDTLPHSGPFAAWKHMALISPDLRQAGMDANAEVRDFPILLRLTASNFNFSEAGENGKDLRFATLDHRVLPHEISYWDPAAGSGAVWIKTDTVRGDGSTGSFLMYWGNPAAAAAEAAQVFPDQAGWSGVWHLDEESKDIPGEFRDATGRFDGTSIGRTAPARKDGVIAYAQDFKVGVSASANIQAVLSIPAAFDPGPDAWTMTFWARRESQGKGIIFAKGDATAPDGDRFQIFVQEDGRLGVQRYGGKLLTNISLPASAWCLVGIVLEGSLAHLYLDGRKQETLSGTQGKNAAAKVFLGAINADGAGGYDGMLDEVWFSHTVRSPDFMRLQFESQKPYANLITVLPQY
jgi:concanavalin A-like lectin/glucanase superfamily protein/uncharacterized protein DUF2341/cadherin-like protein